MPCHDAPIRIGVTEAGDAGLHLDWLHRLDEVAFAILITKSLNPHFLEAVRKAKDKAIVHVTCTGYGGTMIEPKVPTPQLTRGRIDRLLDTLGPDRVVLRIDPIIPTARGLGKAEEVLRLFEDSGVRRVRVSLIDMYPHVTRRFGELAVPHPYQGAFGPSAAQRGHLDALMASWQERYQFETCAEAGPFALGCLSARDTKAMGLPETVLRGAGGQRKECRCPGNKLELLSHRRPCAHDCLYCYWQDPAGD